MNYITKIEKLWRSPSVASWMALTTKILGQLTVLPLLYANFDGPTISFWFVLYALYSMNTVIDFGLTQTITRFTSYSRAEKGIEERIGFSVSFENLVSISKNIYLSISIISLLGFSLAGVALSRVPISHLDNQLEGWISLIAFVVAGAIVIYGGLYVAVLQGTENIASIKKMELVISLMTISTQIWAITESCDLITLSVITSGGMILGVLGNAFLCKKKLSINKSPISNKGDKKVLFDQVWRATWRSGVGVASTTISYQMVGLLYAQYASPEEVSDVMLAQRLTMVIAQFANVPFYVSIPSLALWYGKGHIDKMINTAKERIFISCGLITASTLAVLLVKDYFPTVGIKHNISNGIWMIFAIGLFLERIGAMHLQLYSVTNDIRWHISNGATSIIMLFLIFALPPRYGLYGLVSSIPIAYAMFYVPYNISLNYKMFGMHFAKFDLIASLPWFFIITTILFYCV